MASLDLSNSLHTNHYPFKISEKHEQITQSNKDKRTNIKAYEKIGRHQRELTKKLFDRLTKKLEKESRPPIRQFYLDYLKEVTNLMKQQEQFKDKWISRLNLLKNLLPEHGLLIIYIDLWLHTFEHLNIFINDIVETETDEADGLTHGDTELQFLIVAISSKLTKLVIKVFNRLLLTLDMKLNAVERQFGAWATNKQVKEVTIPLTKRLTARGNGAADKESIGNLKDAIRAASSLWKYIDAQREKRVKYLPHLQVDHSNLLPDIFFLCMDLKKEVLKSQCSLALDKDFEGSANIYLDTTHHVELEQIKIMLELSGYMVKRAVLLPILEQKEASRKICSVCLFEEEEKHLWLCGACLGVTYCGRECQEVDWPQHQIHCEPSKLDKIKRKQKLQFQTIDKEAEIQVRCRVDKFYNV